jgi:hypothetical protein
MRQRNVGNDRLIPFHFSTFASFWYGGVHSESAEVFSSTLSKLCFLMKDDMLFSTLILQNSQQCEENI